MKNYLVLPRLLPVVALCAACSSMPERPGSQEVGSGGYASSRNEACVFEASRALNFGKYDEVERILSRWQGTMEDPRPYALLGKAAAGLGNFGYAAEMFARASTFSPRDAELRLLLAQAHEAEGDWESATTAYAQALSMDSGSIEAALGCLRSLLAAERLEDAFRCAEAGWLQFGANAEYVSLAADVAFATSHYPECVAWSAPLDEQINLPAGHQERRLLALVWSGKFADALSEAGHFDSTAWTPELHRALGQAALAEGQASLALRHFQTYLGQRPEQASAWHELARAQFLAGTVDKALASAEQALRRDSASADCQLLRAHCLLQLGREQEAAVAYCDAIGHGADPGAVQPFLDQLVMREGNSLQARTASAAKEAEPSPRR